MPEISTVDPNVTEPQQLVQDAKVLSPEPTPEVASDEPHALEPGGDRFKQVWARAKSAEEREKRLEGELQHEREERIRYEERLKARDTSAKPTTVYTRQQLEDFVTNGQLTRAQAEDYNEARVRREIAEDNDKRLEVKLTAIRRAERVQTDLDRYKSLVPAIMQTGAAEREKVTAEYRYMTATLGMPEGVATELAAARAAFGDLGVLERSRAAVNATRDGLEATVETTNAGKAPLNTKDPLATLTPREKEHYDRMIKKGRYKGGWADVRAELTWERGKKKA